MKYVMLLLWMKQTFPTVHPTTARICSRSDSILLSAHLFIVHSGFVVLAEGDHASSLSQNTNFKKFMPAWEKVIDGDRAAKYESIIIFSLDSNTELTEMVFFIDTQGQANKKQKKKARIRPRFAFFQRVSILH